MNWLQVWSGWLLSGIPFLTMFLKFLKRRYSLRNTVMLYYGFTVLCGFIRTWIIISRGSSYYADYGIFLSLLHLVAVFIAFKDSFSKIIIVSFLSWTLAFIAEILTGSFSVVFFGIEVALVFGQEIWWKMALIDCGVMYILFSFAGIAWKQQGIRGETKCDLCFILVFLGQILLVMPKMAKITNREEKFSVFFAVGILLMFLFTLIIPAVLSETERRKEEEEKQMQQRRNYQLVEMQYKLFGEKERDLEKVRHDFRNQLTAFYSLASSGKGEAAERLLEEVRKRIEEGRLV